MDGAAAQQQPKGTRRRDQAAATLTAAAGQANRSRGPGGGREDEQQAASSMQHAEGRGQEPGTRNQDVGPWTLDLGPWKRTQNLVPPYQYPKSNVQCPDRPGPPGTPRVLLPSRLHGQGKAPQVEGSPLQGEPRPSTERRSRSLARAPLVSLVDVRGESGAPRDVRTGRTPENPLSSIRCRVQISGSR